MSVLRRVCLIAFFAVFPQIVFAQSADQQILSATDSPDPVLPGGTISYTVQVRNNGPDPATNGGVNIALDLNQTYGTFTPPAGWNCATLGALATCNTPAFNAGVTATINFTTIVGAHLAAFPDTAVSANFTTSGTTVDPNNGNNAMGTTTVVDSQQVDLSVSATDSPDPVFPDGNVTYNVTVTNGGPDTASTVNFNVVPNSSLSFVSATVPAGWNCTLPSVGAINATFTCSRPTWAPGSSNFVVVFAANDEQFGINDTNFQTFFGVNAGGSNETDNPDNQTVVTTTYTTPDADVYVSVVDSPDPVAPDGNITYAVTVGNNGPDTAPNITLNSFGGNNLRFVSATVPAGWNCTLPPSGTQTTSLTCTLASMTSGDSDLLTFVMEADSDLLGINDGAVLFGFSAGSSISDPVNANNAETESTAYVGPDADMGVTVTDSPDPVTPDNNITYTAIVTNAGPDVAPNATLAVYNNGSLRFQSATVPAGWNCTLPAVGAFPQFSCTNPSFAVGASSTFTVVVSAERENLGIFDTTVMTNFTVGSGVTDPNNLNNSETENTAYITPDADLSVTATDAPDPVAAGSNVTYTGTIANAGPDAGTNTTFSVGLDPSLFFQSIVGPAGFTCTTPPVGASGSIICTMASMPSGATLPFTIVAQAHSGLNNGPDGLLQTGFLIGSGASDPNLANNELEVLTAYTTPDADLSTTNFDSPDPVVQGGVITYTQTLTNNGPNTATNATLTEVLPASVGFQSITAPAGYTCTTPAGGASGLITCSIATLPSGVTSTFTVTVEVLASSGIVGNTTTVDSDTFDPDTSDNQAGTTTTITAPASADLSISKSTATTTVTPNGTYTYTIGVTNSGPDTATSVVMTDVLPPELRFQSITSPAGFTCTTPAVGANGTVTCTGGALGSGVTANFQLTVRVASDAPVNTVISNTATVSSATDDNDPADNSSTSSTVEINAASADLSATKTTTATSVAPGASYSYTIVMTNNGPNTASSPVMTDVLPAQLRFVSIASPAGFTCTTPAVGANGTVTCTGGALGNGASATFTLTVSVDPGATAGPIVNTATVSSDTSDPNGANSSGSGPTVTLGVSGADIGITKNTTTTNAPAGSTFSYTIVVDNDGPDAATNVVMTDTLPASLLFQSLAIPTGFICTTPAVGATGTINCTAATLASGATATFTLTVRVAANATAGTVTNSATVSSSTSDPEGGDTTDPAPPVALGPASADLSITKMTPAGTATTGNTLNYTIDVINAGPSAATNVVVTDTLPAGLQLISATPSQGTCSGTTTITCNLGTLASGASATINLQTLVTATSGTISNTATVDGTETDPDAGDNSTSTPPIPVGQPGEVANIPTLSEWALMALAAMIAGLALMKMRT